MSLTVFTSLFVSLIVAFLTIINRTAAGRLLPCSTGSRTIGRKVIRNQWNSASVITLVSLLSNDLPWLIGCLEVAYMEDVDEIFLLIKKYKVIFPVPHRDRIGGGEDTGCGLG